MITTPRLQIRPFLEQDGEALYAYLSDPAVYRFEPGAPVTREQARELARERSRGSDFWAVALRDTGALVGHLYFKQTNPPEFMTWELGYIFNPAHQNRGYATESARALVRHGFAHWGIHRVIAHCSPENVASWRVLEKIGMRREGLLRQNVFFRRHNSGEPVWLDSYAYAMLAGEQG